MLTVQFTKVEVLAKLDKNLYTKEEWRKIRDQRRQDKVQKKIEESLLPSQMINDTSEKRYILCLKHGTKYSADYVNKLYNGVKRHCTLDFEMVCLTDDPAGIDTNIKILFLPAGLVGWWCKPYMFSKDIGIKGTVLYFDLDVVVASNIDKLFTYQPNNWCTIRDFTRAMRPNWPKYNSSVVRFKTGELHFVWEEYSKDPQIIQRKFFGDQDYLYDVTRQKKQAMLYPDSWVQSWKWEVRKDRTFEPGGIKGSRKLKVIENVVPRIECCVCVFHGDPNPHNCQDPWVVENWK